MCVCVCVCLCSLCVCVCGHSQWTTGMSGQRSVTPASLPNHTSSPPPTDDATQNATKSHVFTEIEQIKVKSNHRDTCSGASPGHFVSQVSM